MTTAVQSLARAGLSRSTGPWRHAQPVRHRATVLARIPTTHAHAPRKSTRAAIFWDGHASWLISKLQPARHTPLSAATVWQNASTARHLPAVTGFPVHVGLPRHGRPERVAEGDNSPAIFIRGNVAQSPHRCKCCLGAAGSPFDHPAVHL